MGEATIQNHTGERTMQAIPAIGFSSEHGDYLVFPTEPHDDTGLTTLYWSEYEGHGAASDEYVREQFRKQLRLDVETESKLIDKYNSLYGPDHEAWQIQAAPRRRMPWTTWYKARKKQINAWYQLHKGVQHDNASSHSNS
jgi:hypothetical protein